MLIAIYINKSKKPAGVTNNFYQAIKFIQLNYAHFTDIKVNFKKKKEIFEWRLSIPIKK